jgi:hypothetical protein
MPYELFTERFPELGWKETRSAAVFIGNVFGLPPDEYGLLEAYCNDENCDCRRVFFNVVSRKNNKPIAVVTYGWESEDFYLKWFGGDSDSISRKMAKEMVGLSLDPGSSQSKYANAALELVRSLLQDENYAERIKRHYEKFKETVDGTPKPKKAPAVPKILQTLNQRVVPEKPAPKSRKRHRPARTDN